VSDNHKEKMMSDFKKDDVITVAKAMVNDFGKWECAGLSFSDFDGWECNFCYAGKVEEINDIKHDLDCPVLVAQDILTNHKE
jgi:hypothetical protein